MSDEREGVAGTGGTTGGGTDVDATAPWYRHEPPLWLPRAVVTSALILFGLFTAWWIGVRLSNLLVILLMALFVGIALDPAVTWLNQRGMRRGAGTLLIYGVLFLAFVGFIALFGALVVEQVVAIAQSLPELVGSVAVWLKDTFGVDIKDELAKLASNLTTIGGSVASTALSIGARILSSIFALFTILLFGFYIAAEGPGLRRNVCSLLPPDRQREVLRIWEIAVTKTAGYLYSRTLLALVSSVATAAFLALIKVPNALTLGLFVGFASQFIPTVGTYIAGALPVLVALTISPTKALLVLLFIIGYQQFENYVLSPPLSSRTMQIHPAVAFGAVIAGASLLGAIGALIALPAAATIQAFVGAYVQRRELVDSPLLAEAKAKPGIGASLKRAVRRDAASAEASGDIAD